MGMDLMGRLFTKTKASLHMALYDFYGTRFHTPFDTIHNKGNKTTGFVVLTRRPN